MNGKLPPWGIAEVSGVLTYVNHGPDEWGSGCQMQWDYQIEWPAGGRPTILLLRYRSFQRNDESEKLELVEEIFENIPLNQNLLMNIARHAAGYLSACALLEGQWQLVDGNFVEGCGEAAKKRYSLAAFRKMAQADRKD